MVQILKLRKGVLSNILTGLLILIFIIVFVEIILALIGFNFYPGNYYAIKNSPYFIRNEKASFLYVGYKTGFLSYKEIDKNAVALDLTKKARNEYRIFLLGGSVAENMFTAMIRLEKMLSEKYPQKNFSIYNFGIESFGTDRILQHYHELFHYHTDLILIHSGNNEFLEPAMRKELQTSNKELNNLNEFVLRHSRCYQLLSKISFSLNYAIHKRGIDSGNIKYDFMEHTPFGGPKNCSEFDLILETYQNNLVKMHEIAHIYGIPIIFSTVGYNRVLLDSENCIDFEKGIELLKKGKTGEALNYLEFKPDFIDCSTYSANPKTNAIVREVSSELSIPLADMDKAILDNYEEGTLGYEYFIDRVHYADYYNQTYRNFIFHNKSVIMTTGHVINPLFDKYVDNVQNKVYDSMAIKNLKDVWIDEFYKVIVEGGVIR